MNYHIYKINFEECVHLWDPVNPPSPLPSKKFLKTRVVYTSVVNKLIGKGQRQPSSETGYPSERGGWHHRSLEDVSIDHKPPISISVTFLALSKSPHPSELISHSSPCFFDKSSHSRLRTIRRGDRYFELFSRLNPFFHQAKFCLPLRRILPFGRFSKILRNFAF